ncbi:MAG: hypothetical protein IPM59_08950 [Chloracidobacterium sp.]|nr:hypothetical protein [Chloracidobacterium sp.]
MSPSVAAVLYFACGFPVAIYLVTQRRPTLVKIVVWSLLWPVFAGVLLFRLVFPSLEMRENARRLRIESLAAEIERDAFDDDAMAAVFEFREVFYRYAGLADAVSTPLPDLPDLHERCLARNNRVKLTIHAALARDEFVDAVKTFPSASRRHAIALTELVGDAETRSLIADG